jgi:hypothetical protein
MRALRLSEVAAPLGLPLQAGGRGFESHHLYCISPAQRAWVRLSGLPLWLRLLADAFGTRLRVLGSGGSGRCVTVAGWSAGSTLLRCAPWRARAEEADTVLVELGLVGQRYRAMLEVLNDGATVVGVARRTGSRGRWCTHGCAGMPQRAWVGWPTRASSRPPARTRCRPGRGQGRGAAAGAPGGQPDHGKWPDPRVDRR